MQQAQNRRPPVATHRCQLRPLDVLLEWIPHLFQQWWYFRFNGLLEPIARVDAMVKELEHRRKVFSGWARYALVCECVFHFHLKIPLRQELYDLLPHLSARTRVP